MWLSDLVLLLDCDSRLGPDNEPKVGGLERVFVAHGLRCLVFCRKIPSNWQKVKGLREGEVKGQKKAPRKKFPDKSRTPPARRLGFQKQLSEFGLRARGFVLGPFDCTAGKSQRGLAHDHGGDSTGFDRVYEAQGLAEELPAETRGTYLAASPGTAGSAQQRRRATRHDAPCDRAYESRRAVRWCLRPRPT